MAQTPYDLGPLNEPGHDSQYATHSKHIGNIADHETRLAPVESKLAGVAAGATANATDAQLRDRSTHTGTQSADTIVDGSNNHVFTAADDTKLAGIATGATANSADATLLNRANHTGTQPSSTISDFVEAAQDVIGAMVAAGGGTYNDVLNSITLPAGGTGSSAAWEFFPSKYGAVSDGVSRTVGATLGITTLAALAAYSPPSVGGTPYSWITSNIWYKAVTILPISVAMTSGATTLTFASTTGIVAGMRVVGGGIAANTTVSSLTGTVVTLSAATTASKVAGMTFTFYSVLTDADVSGIQMDALAIQSAVQAAAALGGGIVRLSGKSLLNHPVVLPECNPPNGTQVDLLGAGLASTVLKATADFGANRFLVCCGSQLGHKNNLVGRYGVNFYEGTCADFRLEGYTGAPAANGSAPCNMSGAGHGSRRSWLRVWSWYWRYAFDLVGDHSLFSGCVGQYSYYGLYYNDANPALYGDLRFEYCFFMGNSFAGIGASKNAIINGHFIKPYLGGQPYCIVGEAGAPINYLQPYGDQASTPLIQGSTFQTAQMEWCGNGAVVDLNGDGAGTCIRDVVATTFDNCYVSWYTNDTSKQIAGRGQRYYFDWGSSEGVKFTAMQNNAYEVYAGQLAAFRINSCGWYGGGMELEGALDVIVGKYDGTIPFFAEAFNRFSYGQWRNVVLRSKNWIGGLGMVTGTAAVTKGTVLEASSDFQAVRAATATARPLIGICIAGTAATGVSTDRLIVHARGENMSVNYGSGTVNDTSWVKAAAGGGIQAATGPTDTQVVGWCWHNNGGGTNQRFVKTTFV